MKREIYDAVEFVVEAGNPSSNAEFKIRADKIVYLDS